MDIICIGHITSYVARKICHGIHSFILVVANLYIGHTTGYLDRFVRPIFHIYSSIESDWRKFVHMGPHFRYFQD